MTESNTPRYRSLMEDAERTMLALALTQNHSNRLAAAISLEMHPMTFERKLRQHGLAGSSANDRDQEEPRSDR